MAEQSGCEDCNCGATSTAGAQAPPAGDVVRKLVRAEVPQDYQAKFNVRIVPGRSIEGAHLVRPQCLPRGHAQGWVPGALGISQQLAATLAKADKTMVAWLAKDAANAQRFLENPAGAMREAGVELTRAEEKLLARASAASGAARHVAPGVNVVSLTAKAYPDGCVGATGAVKPGRKADDFGCGPKRKG